MSSLNRTSTWIRI